MSGDWEKRNYDGYVDGSGCGGWTYYELTWTCSCGFINDAQSWSCSSCGKWKSYWSGRPYPDLPDNRQEVDWTELLKRVSSKPQGWECPRCKKVNHPELLQCPCEPPAAMMVNEDGEWVEETV